MCNGSVRLATKGGGGVGTGDVWEGDAVRRQKLGGWGKGGELQII